ICGASQCRAVGEKGEAEALAKVHRLGIVCPVLRAVTIANGRLACLRRYAARPGLLRLRRESAREAARCHPRPTLAAGHPCG
ncbi:MAG TPA: hypothetical protein PLW13_12925, partial [Pseudomonadales bacterium]|nr:hypothetical protein [Pseudomonadales bacterium]